MPHITEETRRGFRWGALFSAGTQAALGLGVLVTAIVSGVTDVGMLALLPVIVPGFAIATFVSVARGRLDHARIFSLGLVVAEIGRQSVVAVITASDPQPVRGSGIAIAVSALPLILVQLSATRSITHVEPLLGVSGWVVSALVLVLSSAEAALTASAAPLGAGLYVVAMAGLIAGVVVARQRAVISLGIVVAFFPLALVSIVGTLFHQVALVGGVTVSVQSVGPFLPAGVSGGPTGLARTLVVVLWAVALLFVLLGRIRPRGLPGATEAEA